MCASSRRMAQVPERGAEAGSVSPKPRRRPPTLAGVVSSPWNASSALSTESPRLRERRRGGQEEREKEEPVGWRADSAVGRAAQAAAALACLCSHPTPSYTRVQEPKTHLLQNWASVSSSVVPPVTQNAAVVSACAGSCATERHSVSLYLVCGSRAVARSM